MSAQPPPDGNVPIPAMKKSNSVLSLSSLGRLGRRRRNSDADCAAAAASASSRSKNNDPLDQSRRKSSPKSPSSPSRPAGTKRRVRAYTKYDYGDPLQGPAELGQSTSRARQRSQSLSHPPIPSEITVRIGGDDAATEAGGGSGSAAGRRKDSAQVPSNSVPSWSHPKRPEPNAQDAFLEEDFAVRKAPTYSEWRALMPAAAPEGPPDRHRRRSSDGREGTARTARKKESEHPITCISDNEQESDVAADLGLDLQNLDLNDLGAPDLDLPASLYPQLGGPRRSVTYPP